ncbi:MAG: leucyl/phenylalanyl-tRNA--protein transferase [Flavobacteriales bacterium]|nr:leucyl/phenylalanyl-tRNA--protein transferase [Flavobacteriales bacterium]
MSTVRPSATIPVEVLLKAYSQGAFPMAHEDGELYWHQPDPRAVFDMHALRPDPKTSKVLRSGRYSSSIDRVFEQVVRACADREETWIDECIVASFVELHRSGHAHSLEVWEETHLVGGIYGVALGGAFFGESMFGVNNAGKVAFYSMAAHLRDLGFVLFDTQYINPFTAQLGAYEIPKAEFDLLLGHAMEQRIQFR